MDCENDMGQKRAKVGGEFGANGEWYEGGKFIATKDRPKLTPMQPRELTPEQIARNEAEARRIARFNEWLASRAERIAELTAPFLFTPQYMTDEWGVLLVSGNGGFEADLARQLKRNGNLSPKQARYFVKFVLGRETKKNGDEWNALFDYVTEPSEFA